MKRRTVVVIATLALLLTGTAYLTYSWLMVPNADATSIGNSTKPAGADELNPTASARQLSPHSLQRQGAAAPIPRAIASAALGVKPEPVMRSLPNEHVNALFTGTRSLALIYRAIVAKPVELRTPDEWHLLGEVTLRCHANDAAEQHDRGLSNEARLKVAGEADAPRVAAREAYRAQCAGIPASEMSMDAVSSVFARLNAANHPAIHLQSLKALIELGFATSAHDKLVELLGDPNPLLVNSAGQALAYEISLTGLRPDFAERGIKVDDFDEAWRLAACDLAGGCAADLSVCIYMGRCDSASPLDYYRRYEPERFASLDALRQRIVDSYRNGDWRWLDLPAVRGRLPGNKQTGSMAHIWVRFLDIAALCVDTLGSYGHIKRCYHASRNVRPHGARQRS
jgi:hypothetical protein